MRTLDEMQDLLVHLDAKWELIRRGQSELSIMVFESANPAPLAQGLIRHFRAASGNAFFAYDLRQGSFHPFEPFLNMIQSIFTQLPDAVKQKIIRRQVYPKYRELFLPAEELFPSAMAELPFELRLDELNYERDELVRSLTAVFHKACRHLPVLVYIRGIEFLSPDAINLFLQMVRPENKRTRAMFWLELSDHEDAVKRRNEPHFMEMLDAILRNNPIYDWTFGFQTPPERKQEEIKPKTISFQDQLEQGKAYLRFYQYALAKERFTGLMAAQQLQHGADSLALAEVEEYLSDVLFMLNELDLALLHYENVKEVYLAKQHASGLSAVFRKIASIQLTKNHQADAYKNIELSLKWASGITDIPEQKMYSLNVLLRIFSRDHSVLKETRLAELNRLKELSVQLGGEELWLRSLAYFAVERFTFETVQERLDFCQSYLHFFRRARNKHALSVGYHFSSLVFQLFAFQKNEGIRYMRKSVQIKRALNDPMLIAYAENTLGYYQFLFGEYQASLDSYVNALLLLAGEMDFREVCLTIYNIGSIFFAHREYSRACEFFELVIKMADLLKVDNIPYHSIQGIYAMIGLSYQLNGDVFRANHYTRMMATVTDTEYEDETYFKYLFAAITSKNNEKAIDYFSRAKEIVMKPVWKHNLPFYFDIYAQYLIDLGQFEAAVSAWYEGYQYAAEEEWPFYYTYFEFRCAGSDWMDEPLVIRKEVDHARFLQRAKEIAMQRRLQQQANEMNIMKQAQSIFFKRQYTISEIAQELFSLFKHHFLSDALAVYLEKGGTLNWLTGWPEDHSLPLQWTADQIYRSGFDRVGDPVQRVQLQFDPFGGTEWLVLWLDGVASVNYVVLLKETSYTLQREHFKLLVQIGRELARLLYQKELETQNELQSSQLEQAFRELKNLMNHTDQGFLTIRSDLMIQPQYSRKCTALFGREIRQLQLSELLFHAEKAQSFTDHLEQLFSAGTEQLRDVFLSLLHEVFSETELNGRFIRLDYKWIQNQSDRSLMVILNDITDRRVLELKVKQETVLHHQLLQIVRHPSDFMKLIESFRSFVQEEWRALAESPVEAQQVPKREMLERMFRQVHTYKGNFSQYKMDKMAEALHRMEDWMTGMIEQFSKQTLRKIPFSDAELLTLMDQAQQKIQKLVGESFLAEAERVKLNGKHFTDLEQQLLPLVPLEKAEQLKSVIRKMNRRSLQNWLNRFELQVEDLSERFGKKMKPLLVGGNDVWVDPERFGPWMDSLIHLIRNSMDHGIEEAGERLDSGKDEEGLISFELESADERFRVRYRDDGKGIDLEKVKKKAADLAIAGQYLSSSGDENDVLQLVFLPELSTKEEVSPVSGRGLGMSAVKEETEKIGGTVTIRSVYGTGTELVFEFMN